MIKMSHRIAGSDTTSTTLSYVCWELSRRPDVMLRLQAELDANSFIGDSSRACRSSVRVIKEGTYVRGFIPAVLRTNVSLDLWMSEPARALVPNGKASPVKLLGHVIPRSSRRKCGRRAPRGTRVLLRRGLFCQGVGCWTHTVSRV